MITDWLVSLGPWAWIVAGLILLGVEILAPGAFFVWFGLAALIVGAVALAVDVAWQAEAVLFVVLAILLVLVGRRVYNRGTATSSGLNDRASHLVGNTYPLSEPLANGSGRIRVGESTWTVTGPDLPVGAPVRVTSYDGSVLKVVAK